jgi:hypothetical protein
MTCIYFIRKDSIRTSRKTDFSIKVISRLMLIREIIGIYSEDQKKHIIALAEKKIRNS